MVSSPGCPEAKLEVVAQYEEVLSAAQDDRTALPEANPPRTERFRWWIWLLLIAVLGGATYLALPRIARARGDLANRTAQRPAPRVPVGTAKAAKGNLPIYLQGLG